MSSLPQYFGLRPWGPAVDEPEDMVPPPVGERCLACDEPIAAEDAGLIAWHFAVVGEQIVPQKRARHRECFLREVLGSAAHQLKKCSCFGGSDTEEGMTKREAARLACAVAGVPLTVAQS